MSQIYQILLFHSLYFSLPIELQYIVKTSLMHTCLGPQAISLVPETIYALFQMLFHGSNCPNYRWTCFQVHQAKPGEKFEEPESSSSKYNDVDRIH